MSVNRLDMCKLDLFLRLLFSAGSISCTPCTGGSYYTAIGVNVWLVVDGLIDLLVGMGMY
jgi:hypothetical protein